MQDSILHDAAVKLGVLTQELDIFVKAPYKVQTMKATSMMELEVTMNLAGTVTDHHAVNEAPS